jgi:phenylalanyl-tRNA synthetase beta chain
MISEGLQEFLTCDLIGPSILDIVNEDEMPKKAWVRVLNPTSIEQSILRTSLLPGLLQAVKFNWDHQNHEIAAFEIGHIHFKDGDNYKEQSVAAIRDIIRPCTLGAKQRFLPESWRSVHLVRFILLS